MSRKPLHRHGTSPGDAAGELGSVGAEQARADFRVTAVHSNHESRTYGFAGLEASFDMLVGLGDINTALRKMDRIRFQAPDSVGENPRAGRHDGARCEESDSVGWC